MASDSDPRPSGDEPSAAPTDTEPTPYDWWAGRDWRRERAEWRRRRAATGRDGPPWGPRRGARWPGFGCLFGLAFLVVAGSLLAVAAFVLSHTGPLPGFVVLLLLVIVLVAIGRTFRNTGRTLDRLVEATRRIEAGDYAVRVGPAREGSRSTRELVSGFDTMAARLETDERQRRDLLAEVSHELRTPLTVVQGNLEAIVDGVYPADPAHLEVVLDETRVLGRLIDDLRTLALSEAGTLALHREPTDPDVLVADVIRSFEPAATIAKVELRSAIEGDLPILDVDPLRIREVLANLVANAIRHTPEGGSVAVAGAVESDARWVRLEVRDTGRGIDPGLLPHVFDRFVTGDSSRGSGLGLAIARQLVLAHRGEITVESTVDAGTTFRVRLPLAMDARP
jgi:two-component system OmpR family sensor kinase/two-component system sensor histidine kinase BaeS